MSGPGHVYEVDLEDGTPTKDNQSGDVQRNAEDGTLSASIPKTKRGEENLNVSLDAVSPAYAEAIESAVIDSTQHKEERKEDNRAGRVAELERENAVLKKEVESVNALLAAEKERKKADKQSETQTLAQYAEQVRSLQDLVKELNVGLSAATQELGNSKQRIETLTEEISQHGGKLRNQEQRFQSEVDAKNEVLVQLEALKTQFRVKDAEYLVAQQNKAEAQSRLGQTNVILTEVKKQNAELLRQLEEERASRRTSSDAASVGAGKPAPSSSSSSSQASAPASTLDKKKPTLPPPLEKRSSDWRPYSSWVPSVVFIGLSAVAVAKLLNK